jgi:hypothetical protein
MSEPNATTNTAPSTAEEAAPQVQAVLAGAAGIFLLEEAQITENGESAVVDLGPLKGKLLSVVLGILETVEQQSVEVSIWASEDGQTWGERPLLLMPQKFYTGTSELVLDLEAHQAVQFLQAKWAVNRWGKGSQKPDFRAYLFLRPA